MSARKPFKPIDEMLLDDVADRVATANNIPTLKSPVSTIPRSEPLAAPRVSVPPRTPLAPAAQTDDRTAGHTQIRIRCPKRLSDQLVLEQQHLRTQGQRVTLNFLILLALQKAGYQVDDADLIEDGRRLR